VTSTASPISTEPKSLLALLCLVLAALPWVETISLLPALAAALFPWLARVAKGTRQYAAFSSVYAAAIVFLLPATDLSNAILQRLEPFFITLAIGYLLGLALDGIQDNTVWAWLAPLLLLIFMPNGLGFIATFGLAVLAALTKQQQFIGQNPYHLEKNIMLQLTAVALLLGTIGFLFPIPQAFQDPTGGIPVRAAQSVQQKQQSSSELENTNESSSPTSSKKRLESPSNAFYLITTALLFSGILILAAFLLNANFEKRKRTGQNSLWDFMPIIAALILAFALLALAFNPPNNDSNPKLSTNSTMSGGSSASEQANELPPDEIEEQTPAQTPLWIPLILIAIGAFFAYLIWRNTKKQLFNTPDFEPETTSRSSTPSQHATNRVRIAYQTFLEYTQTQGFPRHNAETPLEFAVRYSEKNITTRAATITLTNLYEPVRYGKQAAENHAIEAEQALEEIKNP
jgi:hypothetical protein